jgi:cytochrome b561
MTKMAITARVLFWLALVFAVTMAVLPHPPHTPLDQYGDKFEHMTAFAVMSALAAIGYPRMRLPRIGERLSFLGALIEVVQSIPALHRDCDIRDWIADTIAIAITLLIVAAMRKSRAKPSAT